ncbi:MAG: FAD-dependent oxidoreductase [Burkholderiales bacterium]
MSAHKQPTADLIVLGAGPAGVAAAVTAARCGLATTLIDDGVEAGGQIYRAPPRAWRRNASADPGPDFAAGEAMRAQLADSGVQHLPGHAVWSVAPGFEVRMVAADGEKGVVAPKLLVATGVTERIFPFPGWTTPGVSGLAAATRLLKTQQILPGQRTLVAGAGPLVYAVAASIIAGGGRVAAIADLGRRAEWLAALPALATSPALLGRGVAWRMRLLLAGVPVFHGHHVAQVHGDSGVTAAEIAAVAADGTPLCATPARRFEVDSVVVGHGLVPSADITRLLRARHRFAPERGGWVVERDAHFRTSVAGLYAAGDCTGMAGGEAAALSGGIAGLAAAHDAGRLTREDLDRQAAPLLQRYAHADRLGSRMARLMAARPGLLAAISADTIVCRCEDITRGMLDAALDAGAGDCNELKAWTRCGMGPCQGRTCGEATAELLARRLGSRELAGHWTARVPLRPQAIEQLAPTCSYDEIWNSPAGRIASAILPAENTRHMQGSANAADRDHA